MWPLATKYALTISCNLSQASTRNSLTPGSMLRPDCYPDNRSPETDISPSFEISVQYATLHHDLDQPIWAQTISCDLIPNPQQELGQLLALPLHLTAILTTDIPHILQCLSATCQQ